MALPAAEWNKVALKQSERMEHRRSPEAQNSDKQHRSNSSNKTAKLTLKRKKNIFQIYSNPKLGQAFVSIAR